MRKGRGCPSMKMLSSLLLVFAASPACQGALVTYGFSGVVGAVGMNRDNILGVLGPGDGVSGSFSFDPSAAGGGGASDRTVVLSIGSREISISSTLNFVRTQNDIQVSGLGTVDRFRFAFDSNGPTTSLDPLYVYQLDIEFIDTSASVYDGSQTLDVPLNLSDYDVVRFFLRGSDLATRTADFRVGGVINGLSVPEPSAGLLSALGGIGLLRRRRYSPF